MARGNESIITELAGERLVPTMPVGEGLRRALARLETKLAALEPRLAIAQEAEDLHRYRVALRTGRALLSGLGQAAPADLAERFAAPLAELGRAGSEARDLDVWLERFDEMLGGFRWDDAAALEPLRRMLAAARDEAWTRLLARLATAEHRRLREEWRNALGEDWSGRERELADELGEVLERRIDRFRQHARGLAADSPAVEFHDQRKRLKKIRYLLQCFAEILEPRRLERVMKSIRRAQNVLGRLQDLATETAALRRFGGDWAGELDARCLMAMGALGADIARREQRLRALALERMRDLDSNRRRRDLDALVAHLRG